MRETTFSTPVYARLETVWKILLDKMEHPEHFIPGVEETKILDRFEGGLIREIRTNGMTIRERVMIDESGGEIRYEIMEHPLFTGFIVNRVIPTARQSPVAPQTLTLEVNWIPKADDEVALREEMTDAMQAAVLTIKELAEDEDAESPPVTTTGDRPEDLRP